MKLAISIGALSYDTETGVYQATATVQPASDSAPPVMVMAEAKGATHPEAIANAVKKAIGDPVFHKGAA